MRLLRLAVCALGAVSWLVWLAACTSEPGSSSQATSGVGGIASTPTPLNSGGDVSGQADLGGSSQSAGAAGTAASGAGGMPGVAGAAQAGAAGSVASADAWHENWPQAGGPDGTWRVAGQAPTMFSVSLNQNIRWRAPLPGGGQGGIAVWGDRLFLTTFEPYTPGASKMSARR